MIRCGAYLVIGLLSGLFGTGPTAPWHALGPGSDTLVLPSSGDECGSGVLVVNHDWSFENGLCWTSWGAWPEYYGAFGEAYDPGAGTLVCGSFWLTCILLDDKTATLYVWEGGIAE